MDASRKTALVTGATGFIGKRLAERLRDDGWAVRLFVRDAAKLGPTLTGAETCTGDLQDVRALGAAVRDVSVIFHCAANVNTWDNRTAYESANVDGVRHLLQAIADHNPSLSRLVHVSSADVYGFPARPCDETQPTPRRGFGYGDSKLAGEELVKAAPVPYTILRPTNVIGPRSQFVERIGTALTSDLILAIDGGRVNAGFVYIDNLIDYMLWAAEAPAAVGQCYNVRDDYDVDWATFIARFRAQLQGKGRVLNLPFRVAYAAGYLVELAYKVVPKREPLLHRLLVCIFGRTCGHSAAKIRADSGIRPRVGFDEALDRSVRWFMHER